MSLVIRTFKYRIYPTKRQVKTLNETLAICCELYNAALQERRDAWRLNATSVTYFDQAYQLTRIKVDRPDVAALHSTALEHTLKRVDEAFKRFFSRVKRGARPGYPRFRSARRFDSFMLRQIGDVLSTGKLRISKIGFVRIALSRPVDGRIKTLTVKREAGRWFASFVCDVEPQPLPLNLNTVGIDVGLTAFATLSNGTLVDNPRYYRAGTALLRVAQRRVARRKKGSNRRHKAVQLLQRAHVYIRNQRADFQHKLSRKLVNENGLIAVEDLNVKGMASGVFAKSIHDAGWSSFIDMLSYKAESAGRLLIKVDPRGTSQTCICGAEVRKTLAQRWHLCLSCGLSANRDHVSAQVILSRAGVQPSGVNVGDLVPCVA